MCLTLLAPMPVLADITGEVRALFDAQEDVVDLAEIKVRVDSMVDPSQDASALLRDLNQMAADISTMLPLDADSWAKVDVMRQYIYTPGPWNQSRAFSYDHDDPYGLNVQNKLLADYLDDRRGNCITMPVLFVLLGQKLGVDMTLALAPLHVLVKFTDDAGVVHNLEATSGAGRARDQHYRDLLPITDTALANGLYLSPLTREQSIAVMAAVVVEHLMAQGRFEEAIAVADVLLQRHPDFAYILIKKATAAYHLLQREFYTPYPTVAEVPAAKHARLAQLQEINQQSFDRAETLGWRPVPASQRPAGN